ncbi:MAG: shikimate kinase [Mahellales bacterium]
MKNLVLVGMPGAGKSTVGVILAKVLGINFTDTDLLIQQRENRLLQQIINEDGIKRFLEIEEAVILDLDIKNHVIATGGSVVYSPKAMAKLKDDGIIIYLQLEYHDLEERIKNIKTRGIVMERGQTLGGIYRERLPLYEKYKDITINCSQRTIEEVIAIIVGKLRLEYPEFGCIIKGY